MFWHELLNQEILIGLPEDELGFVYLVKYGGFKIRRGFVPTTPEAEGDRPKPPVRRKAVQDKATGAD